MNHPNVDIINKFFNAYVNRDFQAVKEVMSETVRWTFMGRHPLSGVKNGIDEVVAFFDSMGKIMGSSNVNTEKLVTGVNGNYLIETQHVVATRADGITLDHHVCVLWKFSDGKIVEGKHFFADPQAVDTFFTAVSK